ncbi:MAG: hypothetical protein ACRC4W_06120 [Treponemataceae bacterium]
MVSTASLNTYAQVYSSAERKVAVPVDESAVIYSQFKYVSGYASSSENEGISIDRAYILDSLINQLVSAKNSNIKTTALEQMTEAQADKLIVDFQAQVARNATHAQTIPYAVAAQAPVGIIFDIAV